MEREIRIRLEMAGRVREFLTAQVDTEPGFAPLLAGLQERLAHAEELAIRQQRGIQAELGTQALRSQLRGILQAQVLPYVIAVGSEVGRGRPELAERFKLPDSHAPHHLFLIALGSLITTITTNREIMVQYGMKVELIDDLQGRLEKLEAATQTILTERREHISATAELMVVTAGIMRHLKVLDGFTRYRFGNDSVLMAEWKAARQVPRQSHSTRSNSNGDGSLDHSASTGENR